MFKLLVMGPRRAVLAVHRCETNAEVQELVAVYLALGHVAQNLVVEDERHEQAA
jgi:hypothetical protein